MELQNADIGQFLLRFCDATGCEVYEKSEADLVVKLAPEIDKVLTNRPYYWMFAERSGVPAETMTMRWRLAGATDLAGGPNSGQVPGGLTGVGGLGRLERRLPELACEFGGHGLGQIFQVTRNQGKFVRMFEVPESIGGRGGRAYHSWVCFQLKLELICDMKREELLTLAVHLQSGKIHDRFHELLVDRPLQAQLPERTYLARELVSPRNAWQTVLDDTYRRVEQMDRGWEHEARDRHSEELAIHEAYFKQLAVSDEDAHAEWTKRDEQRRSEISRQYEPRARVSLLSCGLFHLDPKIL